MSNVNEYSKKYLFGDERDNNKTIVITKEKLSMYKHFKDVSFNSNKE